MHICHSKNNLVATMTEVNNASTIISINHNTLHKLKPTILIAQFSSSSLWGI
jgi:hypothetical protein